MFLKNLVHLLTFKWFLKGQTQQYFELQHSLVHNELQGGNQEYFMTGGVSWNEGISRSRYLKHTKKISLSPTLGKDFRVSSSRHFFLFSKNEGNFLLKFVTPILLVMCHCWCHYANCLIFKTFYLNHELFKAVFWKLTSKAIT